MYNSELNFKIGHLRSSLVRLVLTLRRGFAVSKNETNQICPDEGLKSN